MNTCQFCGTETNVKHIPLEPTAYDYETKMYISLPDTFVCGRCLELTSAIAISRLSIEIRRLDRRIDFVNAVFPETIYVASLDPFYEGPMENDL